MKLEFFFFGVERKLHEIIYREFGGENLRSKPQKFCIIRLSVRAKSACRWGIASENSSLVLALQGTIEDKHDGEDGDFKSPLLVKTYPPSTIFLNLASPCGCIGPKPLFGRNQMPFSFAWQ